jgi:hypothetical protein
MIKEKCLSVSYYPHNDKQLSNVIETINNFIISLNFELNISLKFRARSLIDLDLSLHNLLQEFLLFSEQHYNCVDINYVVDLFEIIKHPSKQMLNTIEVSHKDDKELCKFFQKAKSSSSSFMIDDIFQFISLKDLKLKTGQGPWGVTYGQFPFTVAIDAIGYKEIIYHEFLHQLSVSEGYDEITLLNTCDKLCWMQYEATKGNLICEKHKNELAKFITAKQLS